jgi:glutaredoxin-dependent peroxiredoxin
MSYQIGDKIPSFTLQDTEGNQVTIEVGTNNHTVLLFFPLAFSSVCTDELCSVRDNMKLYESFDAKVYGISIDSFFSLKAFKQSQNLNFTLLSDFNKVQSNNFGVLNDDFFGMIGVAKRSAFVLDGDMKLVHSEILEDAGNLPNFDKINEALK